MDEYNNETTTIDETKIIRLRDRVAPRLHARPSIMLQYCTKQ